jgi:hypothetical protein
MLEIIPKVYAACDPNAPGIKLTDCYMLNDTQTVAEVYKSPAVLVNLIVSNLFLVAGIIFFGLLMLAGFKYISGGTKGTEEAKKILETALLGFLIMFAAFWIVQIIQKLTGANIIFS